MDYQTWNPIIEKEIVFKNIYSITIQTHHSCEVRNPTLKNSLHKNHTEILRYTQDDKLGKVISHLSVIPGKLAINSFLQNPGVILRFQTK